MLNGDPKNPKEDTNQDGKYNLNKIKSQKLRNNANSVLATIFCTGFLAIGITLFSSHHTNKEKYQFPEQVALTGWELQSSQALEPPIQKGAIAAQEYTYNSPQQADLRIAMIYLNGIVVLPRDLHWFQLPMIQTKSGYQSITGHYLTFRHSSRSYLAACINPRGQATITEDQFMANRNSYDITGDRLFFYLLGMADLRDTRCLLTVISIPSSDMGSRPSNQIANPVNNQSNSLNNPINNSPIEQDYQKLEVIWQQWYQLWRVNFPN